MNMLSITGAQLPPELTDVCDSFLMPVSISLPDVTGTPVVYANQPFEYLIDAPLVDVLGKNLSFLNGPLTDICLAHEMETALAQHQREASCQISYRGDGSSFLHLCAFQPLELADQHLLMVACHAAFSPFTQEDCMRQNAEQIDQAWRGIRRHNRLAVNLLTEHDTFRLEAISMRFEAVFTRTHNALIKSMTSNLRNSLRYHEPRATYTQFGPLAGRARAGAISLGDPFDLGPLSKQ